MGKMVFNMGKKGEMVNGVQENPKSGHGAACGCGICKGKRKLVPVPKPVVQGSESSPAFVTHKPKPAQRSVSSLFGEEHDDLFIFNLARTWSETLTDPETGETFQPDEIARAILFHSFHNSEDSWWKQRMSSAMIRRRVSDFVGRVPLRWSPGSFRLANPDCKVCRGTGQITKHDEYFNSYITPCDCCRRVYDMPSTRGLQREFNHHAGTRRVESLQKAQEIHKLLSVYFLEEQ